VTVLTTDTPQTRDPWRIFLAELGVLAVVAAVVLEVVILSYHSTTTTTKIANVTRTVKGPSAPAAALVTTCLATGLVLLLVTAFYGRISKIAITGVGEIDLNAAASIAGKVAAKAKGDSARAEQLYRAAASKAAGLVSQRLPLTTRMVGMTPMAVSTPTPLDDQTLQNLVDDADKEIKS
jgi:hypothetical protein